MNLTQERLKEVLDYNKETGIFVWKVVNSRRISVGKIAGNIHKGEGDYQRINITIDNTRYKAHRLAWFYVYGEWPEKDLDHINGNSLDNRICNLRECDRYQNMSNSKMKKSNKLGIKGVSLEDRYGRTPRYYSRIMCHRKVIHLGYFGTVEEAALAYKNAALKYHGEFARVA